MLSIDYNNISPTEAVALQRQMCEQVNLAPLTKKITTIAGADISFNKYSDTVYAGIVVLSFPQMEVIHEATAITTVRFPYVPGLLAFRELPALAEVWNRLEVVPDILVLDGHGIAHPRRVGVATHFGIIAQTPAIGCAKTLLVGDYDEPGAEPFSTTDLIHKGEKIGAVLRTKRNCKPVYVSPGNLITMKESVEVIKQCVGKYRIPEPTRQAHLLVNRIRLTHN